MIDNKVEEMSVTRSSSSRMNGKVNHLVLVDVVRARRMFDLFDLWDFH